MYAHTMLFHEPLLKLVATCLLKALILHNEHLGNIVGNA